MPPPHASDTSGRTDTFLPARSLPPAAGDPERQSGRTLKVQPGGCARNKDKFACPLLIPDRNFVCPLFDLEPANRRRAAIWLIHRDRIKLGAGVADPPDPSRHIRPRR